MLQIVVNTCAKVDLSAMIAHLASFCCVDAYAKDLRCRQRMGLQQRQSWKSSSSSMKQKQDLAQAKREAKVLHAPSIKLLRASICLTTD